METIETNPPLNATQLFVLKTFATAKSEQDRDELTSLYLNYIQKKLDAETDRLWAEGKLNDNVIEEMLNIHQRTPYK